jgi:hypothetical protein
MTTLVRGRDAQREAPASPEEGPPQDRSRLADLGPLPTWLQSGLIQAPPTESRADAAYRTSLERWRTIGNIARKFATGDLNWKAAGEYVADRFNNPPAEPSLISMAGDVYRAVADPVPAGGDSAAMVERAMPLATLGMGGGMMVAPRNAAGVFGGRLAVTADRAALRHAEEMGARGIGRDRIYQETGWFRDADDNWLFEINDRDGGFIGKYGTQRYPVDLHHAIKHDELFAAYPDLAHVQTTWDVRTRPDRPPTSASYDQASAFGERIDVTAPGRREARSAYLHDLQHAVGNREGLRPGTSPLGALPQAEADELRALYAERAHRLRQPSPGDVRTLDSRIMELQEKAFAAYRNDPAERMARNVQTRAKMSAKERRHIPPWATED